MSEPIRGGYYLKARCIENSEIAHAPPHVRELWDYLLRRAFWQDGDQLKRGQVLTCCPEIQEALHWKIGWRKERYSAAHIETGMKALRKAGMITTVRTTRGVVVNICNYERYQTPENYENRTENRNGNRNDNRNDNRPIDEEGRIKEKEFKKAAAVNCVSLKTTFKDAPPAAVEKVEEILNCRPEFARARPEEFFRVIADTASNPRADENHREFIRDMVNSLTPPKIPAKLYARYMNGQGKPGEAASVAAAGKYENGEPIIRRAKL